VIAIACVDGGLVCGPIAVVFGLGAFLAWLKCRAGVCEDHDH